MRSRFMLMAALVALLLSAIPGGRPVAGNAPAQAGTGVQLIMVEDPGCPYCARWDAEVGVAYAASAEGLFAPLVRLWRNDPDVKKFGKVIYSPTFIVARDGVEVGRIVGYPGPDFFWGLLASILREAGFRPSVDAS